MHLGRFANQKSFLHSPDGVNGLRVHGYFWYGIAFIKSGITIFSLTLALSFLD